MKMAMAQFVSQIQISRVQRGIQMDEEGLRVIHIHIYIYVPSIITKAVSIATGGIPLLAIHVKLFPPKLITSLLRESTTLTI